MRKKATFWVFQALENDSKCVGASRLHVGELLDCIRIVGQIGKK